MKKSFALLLLVALCGSLSPARAEEVYKIDPVHSSISFKVRHFFSYVTGGFTKFDGTIHFDPDHPEKSSVRATIDAASVNTRNEKRDEDLRSADFFDVAKFPTITFKSKSVKQTGADAGDIVGDLTMHGVTKEITLHAKFLGKGKGMGEKSISGWQVTPDPIKRSDYGLTWSKAVEGTAVVGEEVTISIDVEAGKAP
ncbi:MAG: YceI family protein [Verrucomicrobiota bacterium]|nr:YceI family protein [Chthoniobacterales bacterium]MDQ3413768.1 YceI family protein [Verrucomicrobiota bacterium]